MKIVMAYTGYCETVKQLAVIDYVPAKDSLGYEGLRCCFNQVIVRVGSGVLMVQNNKIRPLTGVDTPEVVCKAEYARGTQGHHLNQSFWG